MEILPFYIAAFAGLYLYFSVAAAADIKGKRRILKVNLVDYLENHLSARMQVTEQDLGMLYGKRTVELMPMGGRARGEEYSERRARSQEEALPDGIGADATRILPVEELDDLLKEFLMV